MDAGDFLVKKKNTIFSVIFYTRDSRIFFFAKKCPTKPDGTERNCSLAPQIVSNSWWKNQKAESDWYDDVISAWHLASIIPVFSVGDHGPKCSTVSSPADRPKLIAVGSTNRNETISWFSGRGSVK